MNAFHDGTIQTIVAIDDEPTNLELLRAILRQLPHVVVHATTDSASAVDLIRSTNADLVLLDLMMPVVNGYQIIERLRSEQPDGEFLPILVLTADASRDALRKALTAGVTDFLAKPFDPTEALLRITNLLRTRRLHVRLAENNVTLEARVAERVVELQSAKREILDRLARATEFRDGRTGDHTVRVGRNARLLWLELGLPEEDAAVIEQAAPLHDVGKVGIPDSILLKPGPLTPAERANMERHSEIGASILAGSEWTVLQMAERIARWHHERWNGEGYPEGLRGNDIPVEARIVQVCDVFDALTDERPYKAAWSPEEALAELRRGAGSSFDPEVVDTFIRLYERQHISV